MNIMKVLKTIFTFFWEMSRVILISLLIIIPIRMFVIQPFIVRGASMEPTFNNGDYLIIDEFSYRFLGDPERGDVIVFKFPQNPSQFYIKRIIGLPKETVAIEAGKITVTKDGTPVTIPEAYQYPNGGATPGDSHITLDEKEYFMLGDNREASSDSRRWGALPDKFIIGRVVLRAWPFERLTLFR